MYGRCEWEAELREWMGWCWVELLRRVIAKEGSLTVCMLVYGWKRGGVREGLYRVSVEESAKGVGSRVGCREVVRVRLWEAGTENR